ncbi:MAG: hypothetical protein ACE5EM_02930 [Sphingomonadales bacterium]
MGTVHNFDEAKAFLANAGFEKIFSRIGYALAGLEAEDIESILELVEMLADECRAPDTEQSAQLASLKAD